MIGYIKEHDNPVTSSAQKSKDDLQILHNIISQEVMPQEMRDDLLVPLAPHFMKPFRLNNLSQNNDRSLIQSTRKI